MRTWNANKDLAGEIEIRGGFAYTSDGRMLATTKVPYTEGKRYSHPIKAAPYAVIDYTNVKDITMRTIYDAEGMQIERIHPTDHGFVKNHPAGGHKHILQYDEEGKLVPRPKATPLSIEDWKKHFDILRRLLEQ